MLFKKKSDKRSTQRNNFIIITGCAGSGKTTIGQSLASQLNYAYIDKDTVTRAYTDFILTKCGSFDGDRESDFYRTEILPIEYNVTFKLCKEILDAGCNVVLTIPFISQIRDIEAWNKLRDISGISDDINIKFIWIKHNIYSEKNNIVKRNARRDAYKLENWSDYASGLEGISPAKEYNALEICNDCDCIIDDTVGEIIKWLKK